MVWEPLNWFNSFTIQMVNRDLEKWNNLSNPHSKLVTGSGLEPRFSFQVSLLWTTITVWSLISQGEKTVTMSLLFYSPWWDLTGSNSSSPLVSRVGPLLLLFFSRTQAGACLSLCFVPSFCSAKKNRERADSGRSWWHRCFLSLG